MTYLPKSELVGVLAPYSINTRDIGVNWLDFGVVIPATIRTISYQGGGIVIAGGGSYIARSEDYGKTWTNIFPAGIAAATAIVSSVYLGSGIGLAGDGIGHIFRSTDYGVNWDLAGGARTLANAPNIASLAYIGHGGIAVAGTGPAAVTGNSIFRSSDFGLNFISQVYGPIANGIGTITYLENGIAIAGDDGGNIHRSINFGSTWFPIAGNPITPNVILCSVYLGKGIVLFGTSTGDIYRSLDYGLTFSLFANVLGYIASMTYIGNGIVIVTGFDGANGKIAICDNFTLGTSFSILLIPSAVGYLFTSAYSDNGIVLAGGGHIWRSDVSYKTNEATSIVDPSIISTTTSITVGQPINTILASAAGGNIIITLDSVANLQKGHEFVIKKTDATSNTVTITPAAGTIDGVANQVLNIQYQNIIIRTDGTNWFITSPVTGTGPSGTGFILGQLKPNIARYAMPGWNMTRGDLSQPVSNGVIYYIPFYYSTTTTATAVSVDVTTAVGGSTIDLRVFAWNDGVPGALFANLGTVSSAATGVQSLAINVTFPQGLYFMAMRANAAVAVIGNNFSYPIAGPVGAMASSNNPPFNNYCDEFIMTVTAAYADPAPAPTGIQTGFPFFLLKEN